MATMFSILRRSYGAAAVSVSSSSSIIIPKFAPLNRRFVSTFDDVDDDDGAVTHNVYFEAADTFKLLMRIGVAPMSEYNSIFSSLTRVGCSADVISLFKQLEQSSQFNRRVVPDVNTWDILIVCHSRQGNMASDISLLHKIIDTGHHPTTLTVNHILRGFCRYNQIHQAMFFYNDIILKNRSKFVLDYNSYLIIIPELSFIGETQMAIDLLRHALQIDKEPSKDGYGDFSLMCCHHSILFRLCKDRLLSQAYDLCSELIHVKNIKADRLTYRNLIYGHCIISQFKQALILKQEMDTSKSLVYPNPCTLVSTAATSPRNLVNEQEVKSAKSAAAVMIKCGVNPNAASYHSVFGKLYKGRSTSGLMNKIAQKVEELLIAQRDFEPNVYNSTFPDLQF